MMDLTEGCIATIMSLTTPPDACRLSLVSRAFKSAGESDVVWNKFLPSDTNSIVSRSDSAARAAHAKSKKELYLSLCDHHVLIHDRMMSFSLDKWSGKKCYMISAKALRIAWKDDPRYWKWRSASKSRRTNRFGKAVELCVVSWFEIRGRIETRMLSPFTKYIAYLVYKVNSNAYGYFGLERPVVVTVGTRDYGFDYEQPGLKETIAQDVNKKNALLVPEKELETGRQSYRPMMTSQEISESKFPRERVDGWLEVELGEYFCGEDEYEELEMICCEIDGMSKQGLIVQGIEIRPAKH